MHSEARISDKPDKAHAVWALLLIVPAPTLGLLAAIHAWPTPVSGQIVFAFAKIWLLASPAAWLVLVDKRRPAIPRPSARGMPAAVITGLSIFVIIIVAYRLFGHWIDPEAVSVQLAAVGLDTWWVYLLGAVYWCTFNSILEEYVWRWFVFTRCETLMPRGLAVIAAGFFFAIHHAIALDFYFDWRIAVLGTLGVFVGGATWSWIYLRWRNIYAAYVSHVFADLAVFGIGWHLLSLGGVALA